MKYVIAMVHLKAPREIQAYLQPRDDAPWGKIATARLFEDRHAAASEAEHLCSFWQDSGWPALAIVVDLDPSILEA